MKLTEERPMPSSVIPCLTRDLRKAKGGLRRGDGGSLPVMTEVGEGGLSTFCHYRFVCLFTRISIQDDSISNHIFEIFL